MAISNVRVVGSNYTTFRWRGKSIAYLDSVNDSGPGRIGAVEAIHPLGFSFPTEFVTPRALDFGSLTFTIRELWDKPVWQHLFGLATAQNIIDVWDFIARDPSAITCQTIIRPPQGNYFRTKTYHNMVVAGIDDTENIAIGTMSIPRNIVCYYTHATRATVAAS